MSSPLEKIGAALSNLGRDCALQVPAIRRLRDNRNMLRVERQMLLARIAAQEEQLRLLPSPFHHYNRDIDAVEIMRRHAVADLEPRPGYLTNFLGVVIDPIFFPAILSERAGQVEDIPIPANWHADIAEWGAALRAVDLADTHFTMIELGCGWGCWLNNCGVAARRVGLSVHLIGVEGDQSHIAFARAACAANGFPDSAVTLLHGIAAAEAGVALFPRQDTGGMDWGLEPIFDADADRRNALLQSEKYDELPMIALSDIAASYPRIDLLHVDIQGGEATLIGDCLPVLDEKIAYLLIGTHSREIEGILFETLLRAGWRLEIERPAILSVGSAPQVTVDGVQGWRNLKLLPDAAQGAPAETLPE